MIFNLADQHRRINGLKIGVLKLNLYDERIIEKTKKENRPELPSDSDSSRCLHSKQVPPRGVEPLSSG